MNSIVKLRHAIVGIGLLLIPTLSLAQYEGRLALYQDLYPGCVDNEETIIFGAPDGLFTTKWPKKLVMPEFPGGDVELARWVYNTIEYPDVRDPRADGPENRPKGIVQVEVVIDRCGRATKQQIIQSVTDLYDMEAIRITDNMPVFKPGSIDGERVKVSIIIPVYFTRNTLPKKKERVPTYDDSFDYW
jgi:hypothetical protein